MASAEGLWLGNFVMIWMYLRYKMYIICRIIPLLRAFCLFFFSFFCFFFCFFRDLGVFLQAQYAFRYDTSSCRAGLTDSLPPWHGDHRATQEQNNYTSLAASLGPILSTIPFRPVLRCASNKHWSLKGGGRGKARSDVGEEVVLSEPEPLSFGLLD